MVAVSSRSGSVPNEGLRLQWTETEETVISSHYHERVEGPIRGLRLPSTVWNKLQDENIRTFDQLKAKAHQIDQIFGIGPKMAQVIRDEITRVATSKEKQR